MPYPPHLVQPMRNDLTRLGVTELTTSDEVDRAMQAQFGGPDLADIESQWKKRVAQVLREATLALPEDRWHPGGGKAGRHSEHFGYLVAEMQHMQRAWPGAAW